MAKPKVISLFREQSYGERFFEVPIQGKATDLFVECVSYTLYVPVRDEIPRVLNLFQEAVLRVMLLRAYSVRELSDLLCIEEDLIKGILRQLEDQGFLQNETVVTKKGREILNREKADENETTFRTVRAFRVKGSEIWLPFLYIGTPKTEHIDEYSQTQIKIRLGTAGRSVIVAGLCVRGEEGRQIPSILSQTTAKQILGRYNRIAKNRNMETIEACPGESISSSREEDIYVHCQGVVPEGDSEQILISDGFVRNVDRLAELLTLSRELKDLNVRQTIKSNAAKRELISTENESPEYETERPGKYPQAEQLYRDIRDRYQKSVKEDTADERRDNCGRQLEIGRNCYSLVEWTLLYYLLGHPIPVDLRNVLNKGDSRSNARLLIEQAEKLGVRGAEKYGGLFGAVDRNKIKGVMEYHQASMKTVLPMAIASASRDPSGAMCGFIHRNPDFVKFLNEMFVKCGKLRHSVEETIDSEEVQQYMEFALRFSRTLLPELDGQREIVRSGQSGDASNLRLMAQLKLERTIGSTLYNELSEALREEMLKIADTGAAVDMYPMTLVMTVSRIMESVLRMAVSQIRKPGYGTTAEACAEIRERYGVELPKSLTTVKDSKYKSALENTGASMGAYVLCLLAYGEPESVGPLIDDGIIDYTDRVLFRREHGNNINLSMSQDEMLVLREETMEFVRKLGDIYG